MKEILKVERRGVGSWLKKETTDLKYNMRKVLSLQFEDIEIIFILRLVNLG